MKGDDFINIEINIKGIYKYGQKQPYICIYDMNGCLISKGYAKCGTYFVTLEKYTKYKVVVKFLNKKVCSYICTYKCHYDIYLNLCSVSRENRRNITFYLKDYYYNLPISKGVLNFE